MRAGKSRTKRQRPRVISHAEETRAQFERRWAFVFSPIEGTVDEIVRHIESILAFLDATYGPRGKTEYPGAVIVERGWTNGVEISETDRIWGLPLCTIHLFVDTERGVRLDPKSAHDYTLVTRILARFADQPELKMRLT